MQTLRATSAVRAVAGCSGDMLKNAAPLISAAVNDKRIKVVGGMYRLADGRVDIFV